MSLEQVHAFYEILTSDQEIYKQYYETCSNKGCYGIQDWNKTKIVNFAASLGYSFTEHELETVWFGDDISMNNQSTNLSQTRDLSIVN